MSFTVASWNVAEGLAKVDDPQRPVDLVETIRSLDKDIVVLSDAYWLQNPLHPVMPEVAQAAVRRFKDDGYHVSQVEYDDNYLWPERYMTVLSRLAVTEDEAVKLGGRNGVKLTVQDPDAEVNVRLVGAHFYDREEAWRLTQTRDMLAQFDLSEPTILAGDLNAMHGKGRARWLRSGPMRALAGRLPHPEPRHKMEAELGRLNEAERLADMASGLTLRWLGRAGLHEVDRRRRSTIFKGSFPVAQLDHILATDHFTASNFQVHDTAPKLSDHRPISATLET
jgi:endonuclease/exonuclease/phosphatase family metal-dependent hydrolase